MLTQKYRVSPDYFVDQWVFAEYFLASFFDFREISKNVGEKLNILKSYFKISYFIEIQSKIQRESDWIKEICFKLTIHSQGLFHSI